MVFSSVPLYLDPSNWPQQPNQQAGVTPADHNQQLPPLLPPSMASGGGVGLIRPGSMAERARLAKIQQPEAALKCPRCESTNTKFCYFNNYSLSQPRHFCKTCRRYWTKGGALRNVPVGGGCRRNKRSKGNNRSKSPVVLSDRGQTGSNPSSSTALASTSCTDVIEHMAPVVPPQLPLLPPLHDIGDFNSGDIVGLNFGGIHPQLAAVGGGPSGGSVLSTGSVEQWRLQQFPFLSNNLEPSTGLYPFEGAVVEPPPSYGHLRSKQLDGSTVSAVPQLASVKLEEIQGGNFSRNFLGLSGTGNEHQFWGAGNAWTDLSGFTSSSTAHLL